MGRLTLSSRPEAVLIIDKDDLYVRSLTRQLRELGFPFVYRAATSEQGLAMLDRVHPTMVFADMVNWHQTEGRNVIARARQLGASLTFISNLVPDDAKALGVPFQNKADLSGEALELLVTELIRQAQQRSRSSVPVNVTDRVA